MSTTLQQLRNIWYAIIKESEGSSAYPTVLMDSLINWAEKSICAWWITDVRSGNQIEKWPLPFLYSDSFYSTVQDVYLTADATIGWTTLDMDTTNLLSSGKVWINGNIITYTGKSATQLTWVTGIWFAHQSWDRVSQLFVLPTDFAASVRCYYNWWYPLESKDYRDVFTSNNNYKHWEYNWYDSNSSYNYDFNSSISTFYTIIQWQYLLPFQLDETGKMLHLMYEKIPTTMSDVTDVCTIPDAYADRTIPYIAVWEFLYNRWEEWRWLELLWFWYWKIQEMYSFYTNQNSERIHNQRARTWKDQYFNI